MFQSQWPLVSPRLYQSQPPSLPDFSSFTLEADMTGNHPWPTTPHPHGFASTDNVPSPTSHTVPPPPSVLEAESYYAGLPSFPRLVARSSTTAWAPGPYSRLKELRVVGEHALVHLWELEDGPSLHVRKLLEFRAVDWTSIDVVRIGDPEDSFAPVVIWIAVMPGSLTGEEGVKVAYDCKKILQQHEICDVEVEIREAITTCLAGPSLLTPGLTLDLREPLCTTLGLSICAASTPDKEGTGGFFVSESGNTEKLYLVTARHILFESDVNDNKLYRRKFPSQRRRDVVLLGNTGFNRYQSSIEDRRKDCDIEIEITQRQISKPQRKDDPLEEIMRGQLKAKLNFKMCEKQEVNALHHEVLTQWSSQKNRIIGHVVLSPPLSIDNAGYMTDWAVIEIDISKVGGTNFIGNVIDHEPAMFNRLMHPQRENKLTFKFPDDRLLRLHGIIPLEEMYKPTAVDQDGEQCLMVLKRGHATGLTIGRANNIASRVRYCFPRGPKLESLEWLVIPRNSNSGPFSKEGDSGSVVVDGRGRIGGILTGGSRRGSQTAESFDTTYVTPAEIFLKSMEENGLHKPNINPNIAPNRKWNN